MQLYGAFVQAPQLITFNGTLTYNSNGFAVLPSYTVSVPFVSMQPLSKAQLRMLPEGTHYADYFNAISNFSLAVDSKVNKLGNYFIYDDTVYKILSEQNFFTFPGMPTGYHWETMCCRDNRLTWNGTQLSIPVPEIDGQYAPLFELIAMVAQCFPTPNSIPVLWAFQQELQPGLPYCTVTLEAIENIDNTNHVSLDLSLNTTTINISNQLIVKFNFYSYDQVQALNLMQQFKLNYVNYTFSTDQFAFIGFVEEQNLVEKELYEDRTIFYASVRIRFSFIVQQQITATSSINTVAFQLSIPPTHYP